MFIVWFALIPLLEFINRQLRKHESLVQLDWVRLPQQLEVELAKELRQIDFFVLTTLRIDPCSCVFKGALRFYDIFFNCLYT